MGSASLRESGRHRLRVTGIMVCRCRGGSSESSTFSNERIVDAARPGAAPGGSGMTQRCFQSTVARLVLDPDFRDRVRAEGAAALDDDLTPVEQERVISIVDDKGLDATRTLHKSFRLTKIYTLLPL